MKLLERHEYTKGNLSIEQIVWETKKSINKELHVMEDMGDYLREVEPSEPIYSEMVRHLHNMKHGLIQKPMKAKYFVFDNNGETYDRYTVIDKSGEMLGLSDEPFHPMGFCQWCGNVVDNYMNTTYGVSWRNHLDADKITKKELPRIISEFETEGNLGTPIKFEDLPTDVQKAVKQRFEEINV